MRDALGRLIYAGDTVTYTFQAERLQLTITGKVVEVWETGIIMAYEDDRVCVEHSKDLMLQLGGDDANW